MENNSYSCFKERVLLCGLLAFGFVARVFYIFRYTTPEMYLWSDPGAYDLRAMQMARDQYVLFSTYWPPFFHIVLSFLYRFLVWLGLENWRIKVDVIIFALLYILAFWCIYQIVKKLFSEKIALIVLALLILWHPLIYMNFLIMSENLFFPLFFFGLYLLVTKPLKLWMGIIIGALWGMAFLSRPIFAFAFPLFLLWGWRYKINWKFLTAFTLTVSLITVSMMLFNSYYTKGEEKSISSNGGVGFAMLWCDAKSMEFNKDGWRFGFGPPANIDYPESKRFFTNIPFTNQKYYYQMGLECLKNQPGRLTIGFSSVMKLFHSHLFPTIGNVANWGLFRTIFKTLNALLFLLGVLTVTGTALNWIIIAPEAKKFIYLFSLIILSLLMIVFLQNIGEERYLIPYAPLLIILSIPLFQTIWKRFHS